MSRALNVTSRHAESVAEPVPASNLLSLVDHFPASIRKLIAKKEVADDQCAKLDKRVAKQKKA